MKLKEKVIQEFIRLFSDSPTWVVNSPGRVNLIGEHTDYNDGFVLPMAINRSAWIAFQPRKDRVVNVEAVDMDDRLKFDLNSFSKGKSGWGEYIKGIAWSLQEDGYTLQGWDGVISGDVPIGAGLSSSAALELAVARTFSLASNFKWDKVRAARLGQKAENQWVGINCGIMDQMISAVGEKDHALLIDCRSIETTSVPLPSDTSIVILDTNTRRELVDSAYNERREQCEFVARHFNVPALRDITSKQLQAEKTKLDELHYRRAHHIISENQRVLKAVEALSQDDANTFGLLMNSSHISMRDDFEISRQEMDAMVEISQAQKGCFGARMTGGGFGGCAVALVSTEALDLFVTSVRSAYKNTTGLTADIYITNASSGVNAVRV